MSTQHKADDGVHRLLDIVVEEVSLVDRAANQHRFLIVKRSEDMEDDSTETADTAAAENQNNTDLAAGDDLEETDNATDDALDRPTIHSPALSVAVAALEGLTEAVELLGAAAEPKGRARLAELAGELGTVSARLAELTGASPASAAVAEETHASTDDGPDSLGETVGAVRNTLARIAALLEGAPPSTSTRVPPEAATANDGTTAASDEPKVATAPIDEMIATLAALTETVKEQQQRLARMEKRFGLPNSAPAGEAQRRPRLEEDVSWPMDLNRGLDRENVDKAVSFHDV